MTMLHSGMTATAAELMYIRIVQQLPEYGHESFDALVSVCLVTVFRHVVMVTIIGWCWCSSQNWGMFYWHICETL